MAKNLLIALVILACLCWGLFLYDHRGTDRFLIDNQEAADVSWIEVKAFLEKDTTEDNEYIEGVYACTEFASDVHNNAEAAGIRAGFVSVCFEDGSGHALVCFNTTDRGLVFVESQCSRDSIIFMEVGGSYIISLWGLEDKGTSSGTIHPGGIVTSIKIRWDD